ncbi:hypothetical protein RRG08_024865 [Elysia crispata]|uniref:Uncharacterized protein n=1 Tax=Elysia crispata TaxID=231223 RepID=A0AAE0YJ10_9GAST|nr:hypothetical protein RRG08_024865 [Elysia crispata]
MQEVSDSWSAHINTIGFSSFCTDKFRKGGIPRQADHTSQHGESFNIVNFLDKSKNPFAEIKTSIQTFSEETLYLRRSHHHVQSWSNNGEPRWRVSTKFDTLCSACEQDYPCLSIMVLRGKFWGRMAHTPPAGDITVKYLASYLTHREMIIV